MHSKILIIDDDILLVGSANINDRSMLGHRDSEIAVVIEDTEKIESMMNYKSKLVSPNVHNLRIKLYMEFLGVESLDLVMDPLSIECIDAMEEIASRNTDFYRKVFRSYPDDSIDTYK